MLILYPILFKWGPVTIRSYGVLIMLGLIVGVMWTRREFLRRRLPLNLLYDATSLSILLGVIGARLTYVALNWGLYRENLSLIPRVWADGGLTFYGAILGGILGIALMTRRYRVPFPRFADASVAGLALGHSIGRIGCFFNGCCYGVPTTLPWSVRFINPSLGIETLPSHPTQLYESAGLLVLSFFLTRYSRRLPYEGAGLVAWVIGYSIIRFIVEFWRAGATAKVVFVLTQAQWVSLVLFVAALIYHRRRVGE